MTLSINTGAIQQETGVHMVDALLQIQRSLAETTTQSNQSVLVNKNIVLYAQVPEPPHPDNDNTLGLWLYNPPGASWQLAYSGKKADGNRMWVGLTRAT